MSDFLIILVKGILKNKSFSNHRYNRLKYACLNFPPSFFLTTSTAACGINNKNITIYLLKTLVNIF